ncbi:MAG: EAL domain-containing protein, partial [Gammaproteobacteria bacterium]
MDRSNIFNISQGSPDKRQSLLLVLLVIGGVIVSFAVFSFVRIWEFNAAKADFELLAEAHDATLQKEIQLNLDIIEYIYSFYRGSDYVSRAEFKTFVSGPLAQRSAVRQLGWVPRIKAADRESFVQGFRAEGFENFQLTEKAQQGALTRAGERAEYFPVQYLEPAARGEALLGVDLAAEPLYRDVLLQARDSGKITASGRIAMGESSYYEIMLVKPVYRKGALLDSVAARREHLTGFLMEMVDVSTLLGEAVVSWGIFEIDITLLDEAAAPLERVLFHYDADTQSHQEGYSAGSRDASMALYWRSKVNMPGRKWVLVFQPGRSFILSHRSWESWLSLFTGLTLTFLLCALQFSSIRRTHEVEKLAAGLVEVNTKLEKQIAERRRVEEIVKRSRKMLRLVLDTIPVRVFWKDRELNYMGCNRRFAEDAGMATARDIVGKDDYQLAWKECADLYRSDDQRVIENGEAKYNFEEPQIGPDGKRLWLRTSKIPLTDMDDKVIGVLGTYEDITQQKEAEEALQRESAEKHRIEQALIEVADAVSSSTGDEFFRILVKNLTRTLDMDVAFIAAFQESDGDMMETLAVCIDDEIADNFSYHMTGTPCEEAMRQNGYYHPRGLAQKFSHCRMLVDVAAESYLGTPLYDTAGNALGIVVVMSRQAMDNRQPAESILQIFANRTAAELRHRQAETEIRDLIKFPNENPSPVLRVSADGILMYANQGSAQILDSWACTVGKRVPENILGQCHLALQNNRPREVDIVCGEREYSFMFAPSVAEQYISIFAHDITERQHTKAEMSKLSRAVEQTAESIFITDAQGIIEYVNPAFEKTTGYSREEVLGKTPSLFKSGRHEPAFYEKIWKTILAGAVYSDIMVNRRKDGTLYYEEKSITPLFDEKGEIGHFISTGKDITERMQAEERLHHLAYHDVLTDLPNRALFMDRLTHALTRRHSEGSRIAVMFLDVDRFKTINDTLGHDSGDRLLQSFARMLMHCVREGDTVSRFGGDEFAILLEDVTSLKAITQVADKIKQALSRPFKAEGQDLYVTTSIGISLFPDDGDDAATLLKYADSAMYRAKEVGRNNHQFYAADMSAQDMERLTLEHGLRHALARNEFSLVYQPQVDVASGRIIGSEALLRWQSPDLGLVSPEKFIPLLEDTGLILEVGEWVLRTACLTAKQWGALLGEPLHIAVNVSGRQFYEPELNILVARILDETGLEAQLLELEITESVLMQNDQCSLDNLGALHRLGVHLAIDDFGTGYSSLSYLKRFPVDRLKIDRSFIRDITTDPDDATIVSAITVMARRLNLMVIAEGVENEE